MESFVTYTRTPEQQAADRIGAKEFEQTVGLALGKWTIDRTSSHTELDFWSPGYYLDVKEKRQPLSPRWHRPHLGPDTDLFVLDELSVRKALKHYPYSYFLIRDLPNLRMFLASAAETAVVERDRVMRGGKGKLIYNMTDFRPLQSLEEVHDLISNDLISTPWTDPACIGHREVDQV